MIVIYFYLGTLVWISGYIKIFPNLRFILWEAELLMWIFFPGLYLSL